MAYSADKPEIQVLSAAFCDWFIKFSEFKKFNTTVVFEYFTEFRLNSAYNILLLPFFFGTSQEMVE